MSNAKDTKENFAGLDPLDRALLAVSILQQHILADTCDGDPDSLLRK